MMDELIKTIAEVEREKGIERDILIEALEAAMLTAARKKKGLMADLEAQFDEETGEIHVIEFKTVVEQVENPDLEITLDQALEIEDDPDLQIGDQIGLLLPTEDLGRIAAQTAKQVELACWRLILGFEIMRYLITRIDLRLLQAIFCIACFIQNRCWAEIELS